MPSAPLQFRHRRQQLGGLSGTGTGSPLAVVAVARTRQMGAQVTLAGLQIDDDQRRVVQVRQHPVGIHQGGGRPQDASAGQQQTKTQKQA
jgi:hypothetical protein